MVEYIQWNGLNLEDVQQYVGSQFTVKRSDNNDNNLSISFEDELGVPYEDVITLNQFLYVDGSTLAIIDEEDIEVFLEQLEDMDQDNESHVDAFVSDMSDLINSVKDGSLKKQLRQLSNDKPFNEVRKHVEKFDEQLNRVLFNLKNRQSSTGQNACDCDEHADLKGKANEFKTQSIYHVKRVSNDVFNLVSTKVDALKDKHEAKKADEHQLFEQLRANNSYNGLSDDELRRLVRSRILFK